MFKKVEGLFPINLSAHARDCAQRCVINIIIIIIIISRIIIVVVIISRISSSV